VEIRGKFVMNLNSKLVACAYLNASLDGGVFDPTELLKKVIIDVLHTHAGKEIGILDLSEGIRKSWGFAVPEATIADHLQSGQVRGFWTRNLNRKFQVIATSDAFDALDLGKAEAKNCIDAVSRSIARELLIARLNTQYTPSQILSDWLETGPLGIAGFDPNSVEASIDPMVHAIIMKCSGVNAEKNSDFLDNLTTIAMGDLL
jgi:hypothetical protein